MINSPVTPSKLKQAKKRLLQMHYESNVGHLGGNLSCIDALLVIFHEFLKEKDEFVLSKGHSAGALYIGLWSLGAIPESALASFHKDETLLPAHPSSNGIPKISFATGSLGHGLSLAAGLALGIKLKGRDDAVICLTSDGEWQEGSTWEALIFAIHNDLKNLTIIVDHNELQGFGATSDVASMAPLWEKLEGFSIKTYVIDGHNLDEIRSTIADAKSKLCIIFLRTVKGHGIEQLEGKLESHYLPLTQDQYSQALRNIDNAQ